MRKRIAFALTALLAAVTLAGAAPGAALAQDNTAVAVNTKDGASVFKFAFDVRRVMNGVVDQTNAAVAYANCADCQTVAIAIQVVLVFGDANVVTPENYAIAINEGCETCATLASAYQFVLGTPEGFRFSKEAWKRIIAIRKEIRDLGKDEELSIEQIQARVDALVNELRGVIKADIAAGGARRERDDDEANEAEEATESTDADEGEEDEPMEPTGTTETTGTETTETTTTPTESVATRP